MTYKQYDSLKEGTEVELRINEKVVSGKVVKRWQESGRKAYLATFFVPEGGTRAEAKHHSFMYLKK